MTFLSVGIKNVFIPKYFADSLYREKDVILFLDKDNSPFVKFTKKKPCLSGV